MKYIIIFYCFIYIKPLSADVYKCNADGNVVFSQFPCSEDAKKIKINVVQPINNTSQINNPSHEENLNDVNEYIEISQINRNIKKYESKIKTYQGKLNQEVKKLELRASYATDNLAGATYENALTTQMQAVTNKYNTLIEVEQNKINRLLSKKDNVGSALISESKDIDTYIRDRKIQREKNKINNKIKIYKSKMIKETNELKLKASFASNNLSGANYEKAISNKISAITTKYKGFISTEEDKLKKLVD